MPVVVRPVRESDRPEWERLRRLLRRPDVEPRAIRAFLRDRMHHYDLDLPHRPLFGTPPGDWPEV
jgi:hypothetical protein